MAPELTRRRIYDIYTLYIRKKEGIKCIRSNGMRARTNQILQKHGITFGEACSVFLDEDAILKPDPDHSDDEERFILLGLSIEVRLLVVVHCFRDENETIRIISARKATKTEAKAYIDQYGEE